MRNCHFVRSQMIQVILLFILMLTSCVFPIAGPDAPKESSSPNGSESEITAAPIDAIRIYFSDPAAPRSRNYTGGPDEQLKEAIDQARLSVDVAAYNFNLWSIRDALIHAHKRGVVVRMVMESDNMDGREIQQIKDAGIPVVGDQSESLMHDKFVVIDRTEVWTGSMNFTVGGAYRDNNNLVVIHSEQIARDFTIEFEEMFITRLFGQDVMANNPYPELNVDGIPVEVYFSPDDHPAARILELIQEAEESIYFMAFNFTSNELGNAIILKAQEGINVVGVMDDTQVKSSQGTEYDPFMQAQLNVRLDGNPDGLLHHKVIIIDQKIIITGSYNFTASAEESNDENVVIIFSPQVAGKFVQEFERIHDLAQPMKTETTPEPAQEPSIGSMPDQTEPSLTLPTPANLQDPISP